MAVLESVPNVSEGRDPSVIEAIADALSSAGAKVLDVHVDPDHHRSVVTLVGDEPALEDGLVAGIDEARRRIDLRRHTGVHPRVGAADVVPVVPLERGDLETAVTVARAVGRRVGDELGLPVFLYGALAEGRRPAFYRRGGPATLQARVDDGELRAAYGPRRLDPAAGAVLVGVRAPLLAFNLEVGGSFEAASALAAAVRESSGGLPGVQALALELASGVQLSTNVIDLDATPPHVLVERVLEEAAARGLDIGAGELVGLIPAASVADAAAAAGAVEPVGERGLPTPAALAAAARALRLERLEPDRVLEWHLR